VTPPQIPRAHPRHRLRLSAELDAGGRRFAAVTRDLSEGGCCVEAAYPIPEGGAIELALFLVVDDVEEARLPPLRCAAEVAWATHNEDAALDARHVAGLRFVGLTSDQGAWLARFLTER
jgi:hypothetical protein